MCDCKPWCLGTRECSQISWLEGLDLGTTERWLEKFSQKHHDSQTQLPLFHATSEIHSHSQILELHWTCVCACVVAAAGGEWRTTLQQRGSGDPRWDTAAPGRDLARWYHGRSDANWGQSWRAREGQTHQGEELFSFCTAIENKQIQLGEKSRSSGFGSGRLQRGCEPTTRGMIVRASVSKRQQKGIRRQLFCSGSLSDFKTFTFLKSNHRQIFPFWLHFSHTSDPMNHWSVGGMREQQRVKQGRLSTFRSQCHRNRASCGACIHNDSRDDDNQNDDDAAMRLK